MAPTSNPFNPGPISLTLYPPISLTLHCSLDPSRRYCPLGPSRRYYPLGPSRRYYPLGPSYRYYPKFSFSSLEYGALNYRIIAYYLVLLTISI